MTKDKQNLDEMVLQDILDALEDALREASWDFDPIGFLPCSLIQQFAPENEWEETFCQALEDDDLCIEIICEDDDVTHLC